MNRIRRHLSAKLSIGITLLAAPIFVLALGILFLYSRHLIRRETMKQATSALHTTGQRVKSTMSLVQNAVNSNCWLLEEHFRPDSLESICQRITLLNRTVSSCSITTDTLEIRKRKEGCVVSITAEGDTVFTYSKALRPDGGDIKGMITATLPFKRLATVISQSKAPTPGSCFLLKKKGERCDETEHLVFYQDLQGIDWNLVLVCPESELLASYHQLFYLGTGLLIVGLLLILLICYLMTKKTIRPLHRLLALSKKIVNGQYDEKIPHSMRMDAIGRLQNSFSIMQRSLSEQVGSIRETTEQTQKHNKKLASAMALAEEGVRKKAVFIQNVTHQMRTPLNIIMGFADVLVDSLKAQRAGKSQGQLQEQELADIIDTMTHNAIHLNRMVQMLCDSSEYGTSHNPTTRKDDCVAFNTIAQECIDYTRERFPKTSIYLVSELTDSTTIMTNHTLLMRTLRELLFNAAKYSDGQHITLHVTKTETAVRFVVEDVGPGLRAESEELIFKPFMKVNDLSEGLGLGLPLSRSHALRLGGNLTYDNSYHEGCRFILEIPK